MIFFSYFLTFILASCLGSFLNVVIYRLPKMMEAEWQSTPKTPLTRLNLAYPGSHCPHCQQSLRWEQLLPLLSFLWLKGRCAFCRARISGRYPLVELLTALMGILLLARFELSPEFFFASAASAILLCLIFIDLEQQLLPDLLTLSLLWLGLIASLKNIFVTAELAILGAAVGYLSLWLVAQSYYFLTKREGLGLGDCKLLAALGAWLGWQTLPLLVLIAALLGILVSLSLVISKRAHLRTTFAFGPYLALAGWLLLVFDKVLKPHLFFLYLS